MKDQVSDHSKHFTGRWDVNCDECHKLNEQRWRDIYSKLGKSVFHYIDRMNDLCESDPAERVLNSFLDEINPMLRELPFPNPFASRVCPTDHTTPGVFLINTMSREVKRDDLLEHFRVDRKGDKVRVTVQMEINGVPVDFEKSITEMWERLQSSYDEDVLKKATELVNSSRLSRMHEILNNAEWELEREVKKLFNEGKA